MSGNPLVVSFFTKNTPYEKEAEEFIASCKTFGIEHEVEALESRGSWDLNCALKPRFLLQKLKEKKRPLLWVDIDGRFLQPLCAHDWDGCDFSLRVNAHLPEDDPNTFYAATVYCSYEPRTVQLVEEWMLQCERDLAKSDRTVEVWDQQVLQNVLARFPEVRFRELPWKFAKVFDADSGILSEGETIIEHLQASRRLKKHVCQESSSKYRIEKIEEMLDVLETIDMTCLIEVDETNLMELGSCLYTLVPFLKKTCVVGKFGDYRSLDLFSQVARIYPFIPFLLEEPQVRNNHTLLRLKADQTLDGGKLFFHLLERKGSDLPSSLGPEPFLDPLKKKIVDLSKHPFLTIH